MDLASIHRPDQLALKIMVVVLFSPSGINRIKLEISENL